MTAIKMTAVSVIAKLKQLFTSVWKLQQATDGYDHIPSGVKNNTIKSE